MAPAGAAAASPRSSRRPAPQAAARRHAPAPACLLLAAVVAVSALTAGARADAPAFAFFEQHVASKCFAPPEAVWSVDGTSETVLRRETKYFGIYETAGGEGFYFHYSITTRQTEYNLQNGKRVRPGKTEKRTTAYRCQFGIRRSTKAVLGICYPSDPLGVPATSTPSWPFTVYVSSLVANSSALVQSFDTLPPYEDMFAATPSGVKPGRQETSRTFSLDGLPPPPEASLGAAAPPGGRGVAIHTRIKAYDVDPASLERHFAGEQVPSVEHEVECSA